MILKVKTSADIPYSEVTPESIYRSRREFLRTAAAGAAGVAAGAWMAGLDAPLSAQVALAPLKSTRNAQFVAADKVNSYDEITTYNNYYEFGTQKSDPAKYAGRLTVKPWTVKVDGMCAKPGSYAVEDLVNFNALEERVYRHRCVEAWSMVMPFIGVPLSAVLSKLQPQPEVVSI